MKWQSTVIWTAKQAGLIAVVLTLMHFWQTRHMLDDGQVLPEINLPRLDGAPMQPLWQAGKPALVYVMAPWCGICHLSAGHVDAIHRRAGDEMQVVMLAQSYQQVSEVQAFVQDKDLSLPVLLGDPVSLNALNVRAFPSYYLLDDKGQIRYRSVGYTSQWGLQARLWLMRFWA